ncbi:hypothetical protein [Desulfonatronospira sp.]|uniref:magnesium transporter MgtE N-terminal domain-containing protein n=1 Tax=Desulfonatronospira sp. TaxID=1962951 RepID=UPI0025BA774C|nr:hypothetical protein [Desulfonatronospira sp.]
MSTPYINHSLQKYLEKDETELLHKFCKSLHPLDLACALEPVSPREAARVLGMLEPGHASRVLAHMNPQDQAGTIRHMPDNLLNHIAGAASRSPRGFYCGQVSEESCRRLWKTLSRAWNREQAGACAYGETAA